ncbi:GNAT family N-acetyltransferase [Clostridium sp. MSJ-11]|uniref:GNAT family N-acetyltransferase n=1 Tax=Clostridium mobile TaxID=2841512 RepID=A0ABS6EBW4_9CLOT|nr:GNAT family N-acetyltransferase [Clostridium mobile]MBU5482689.1 GNAT family N-acetyltransferase [Clostridium mobile]
MFNYKTLENIDIKILHIAFLNAFSDYEVKLDLPLYKFKQMLKRKGYSPELSIGAFKNEALVGFIFNGLRNWDGKASIYDLGTGVIPEYRKQGVTSNMFDNMLKLLKQRNIKQYLLEVIQSNIAALELYKKQDFKIIRTFSCFQLDKNIYNSLSTYKVEHIDEIDSTIWDQLIKFWEITPSWQNSIDSIKALPDSFTYTIVSLNNTIVGYGIIDKKTGDIPQIAVDSNHRGKGVGESILTNLISSTESNKISIINVDDQSTTLKNFLYKSGFNNYINQYEMLLEL